MLPHVTEMQLDLYLDDGLDPEERRAVQAHLATCAACRHRLDAMRPLFQALEGLAVPLPEGFAQEVIKHLEKPIAATSRERRLTWLTLTLEGVAALVFLALLIGRFGDLVPLPPAGWLSATAERLATALQAGSELFHERAANLFAELTTAASSLPGLLPFQLTAMQTGLILVTAMAVLLIGNGLLLRNAAFNGNGLHQEM
jgi:anti-sigma factor RsiW